MSVKQEFRWKHMTMGVCYYPEHWDESLWGNDLDRMLQAGIEVIRIGEFAWNRIEPEEGKFTFAFFEKFLDLCLEKGMQVIYGTPTAAPPAWLTEQYPEVLNCREDGVAYRHGGRRHYNYNSAVYQRYTAAIVTALAKRFGAHPAIIGWQIDNELNCETCEFYSEADSRAFRTFLMDRYGTLDALNQAWGTVFWNQTYTAWEQIYVPRPTLNRGINPHMHLDYYRFISDSVLRFCRLQAGILRKYRKQGDFITTNGLFWNIDNHQMEEECLDVFTYDCYPDFAFGLSQKPLMPDDLLDRRWSKNLNEVRSVCPHFGIMEQQSGSNGWTTGMEAPAPRPGQLTLWAMQSVAHGADFISFFRWRTSVIGTEIYWHGILDYDGRDNRRVREVQEFGRLLKKLDPVCSSEYVASFALLKDYDNIWDTEVDAWHARVASHSEDEIFAASELSHIPYDVVYLRPGTRSAELQKYPILFYPHPVIMDEKHAALLREYVEEGGILVIGCRSGYKDQQGHCVMHPQPGLLQPLTGTDVRDFTFLSPAEEETFGEWDKERMETPVFNDVLTALEGTKVLAVYGSGYYAGEAALTEKKLGKGRVLHLGSGFSRGNVSQLFSYLQISSPFDGWVEAQEGVELVLRRADKKDFLFVLNFQPETVSVELQSESELLYTGETCCGRYELPAYGTAVFCRET